MSFLRHSRGPPEYIYHTSYLGRWRSSVFSVIRLLPNEEQLPSIAVEVVMVMLLLASVPHIFYANRRLFILGCSTVF